MKKYIFLALSLFLAFVLQSCLKKDGFDNGPYGPKGYTSPAVSFARGTSDTAIIGSSVTPSTSAQINYDVQIDLEGTPPLATDVPVTVTLNNGLLANKPGITAFPAGAVTFPAQVVIVAGKQFLNFPVTLTNSSLLSLTTTYGLGLTITAAGLPIVNTKKNVILQFNVKNQYDGVYSVESGLVTRYTAPGTVENPSTLNGPLDGNPDVILITSGANSVSIPPSSATEGNLFWRFGSNSRVAGVDGITITIDPSTNLTTATSAGNATFGNWAGKVNRYDPATKTFTLSFRWNPTANVREYEIVLKYKGPR